MKKCPGGIVPSRSEADGACDGFAGPQRLHTIAYVGPDPLNHHTASERCNERLGSLWYSFCQIQPVGGTDDHRPKGVRGCWAQRWGDPGSLDLDTVHMAALAGALNQPE